jgi:hypothetical protein
MNDAIRNRRELAGWISKFHEEAGTATPQASEALELLKDDDCLVIVTAHQPNLFPYSGIIRKATLTYVLGQELSRATGLPTVNVFAFADQDFTDDRWVKSALLPDVEKREGALELRATLPPRMMLNAIPKPPEKLLDNWRRDTENWILRKLKPIQRSCESFGINFDPAAEFYNGFREFWSTVQSAYERAESYADFNAFILSNVVNNAWGYDTLFCRFSETQRIFKREFNFLLSRFKEYSQYVKEVSDPWQGQRGGISQLECRLIPFWYHCDCGSKARLTAVENLSLSGRGECVRCGREFEFVFRQTETSDVTPFASRISARAIAMPMVFLDGLKACCYVGGVGGKAYSSQAEYVATRIGIPLPPTVIWRPHDHYLGLGQAEALLTYRSISGGLHLSYCQELRTLLRDKLVQIQQQIAELETEKQKATICIGSDGAQRVAVIRALGAKQDDLRKRSGHSTLARNFGLLENVESVMSMHPSIIDYAINVGLRETSAQWISFLTRNGNLLADPALQTNLPIVIQDLLEATSGNGTRSERNVVIT